MSGEHGTRRRGTDSVRYVDDPERAASLPARLMAAAEHERALVDVAAMRNEFVNTVSHELRTPLTSVVSFAHLLGDRELGQPLSPQQQMFVEVIERNANRLLQLLEDLLLLVQLESRRLPLEPASIEPAQLLDAALTEWRPVARAAGIALAGDSRYGPPLSCDEVRVQQLLSNLIGNAVKFTPTGGKVRVHAEPDSDGWWLRVQDTGIGVPADEVDAVFTTFGRASNASRTDIPGTGLGLVIARAIVELHGGSITLASDEGVGTAVSVHLPWQPAES